MNARDINDLERLNERYGRTNLTGFKLVTAETSVGTLLDSFLLDLETLSTTDVKTKQCVRVILRANVIDICSYDNGTPVAYFFAADASFTPKDVRDDIGLLCDQFDLEFDEL